jgi:hypothetical protein
MTDVLELARECEAYVGSFSEWQDADVVRITTVRFDQSQLTAFAARIREEALEEAAKACEEWTSFEPYDPERSNEERGARNCADAIRALAQQGEA